MIKDNLEYIILVGGAVTVLAGFSRHFYRLFKTWFKFIEDWNGSETKPGIPARLDFIESELKPNSGSSIKDKIDKLESKIDFIYQTLIKKD